MQIIPVIDLQDGRVVHARRGERAAYAPIRSSLATGASPAEIAAALLAVYPFASLYLADLDAIQRRGHNNEAIAAIHAQFPEVELWVDTGIADIDGVRAWRAQGLGRPVLGTECMTDHRLIDELRAVQSEPPPVLSLDFGADGSALGPIDLLARPAAWPNEVIAMTLARVGADTGPDWTRLRQIVAAASRRRVYAAGGVRSAEDLRALQRLGVAGALVASSLHDGRLTSADLARVATR